jgi:hypothetical protein
VREQFEVSMDAATRVIADKRLVNGLSTASQRHVNGLSTACQRPVNGLDPLYGAWIPYKELWGFLRILKHFRRNLDISSKSLRKIHEFHLTSVGQPTCYR